MAFSYDYKHASDFNRENRESEFQKASSASPTISRTMLEVVVGSLFLGLLLIGSWSMENLFMTELLTVSFIWGLVSLIRLKSQPEKSNYEKR